MGVRENIKLKEIMTHYELWQVKESLYEELEYIAIIYDVVIDKRNFDQIKTGCDGNDSLRAKWFDIKLLKEEELSPLAKCIMKGII